MYLEYIITFIVERVSILQQLGILAEKKILFANEQKFTNRPQHTRILLY